MKFSLSLLTFSFLALFNLACFAYTEKIDFFIHTYNTGDSKAMNSLNERLRVLRIDDDRLYDSIRDSLERNYLPPKKSCTTECSALISAIALSGKEKHLIFLEDVYQRKKMGQKKRRATKRSIKLFKEILEEEKAFSKFDDGFVYETNQKKRLAYYLQSGNYQNSRLAAKAIYFEYEGDNEMAGLAVRSLNKFYIPGKELGRKEVDTMAYLIKALINAKSDEGRTILMTIRSTSDRYSKLYRYSKKALAHYGVQ